MRHPIMSRPSLAVFRSLALIIAALPTVAAADPAVKPVKIDPASRVEQINSPGSGLPDQEIQHVTFESPLKTSLVTVGNRSGTGHRSFALTFHAEDGGSFEFSARENSDDVTLALTQPIPSPPSQSAATASALSYAGTRSAW